MPPLLYEKAILRSFVPTWRESLILYLKNGSLEKSKNQLLIDRLGNNAKLESEFQNGMIIVSSGVDINRLLYYLVLYIANPLHVYEFDTLTPELRETLREEQDLDETLRREYEQLLDTFDRTARPAKKSQAFKSEKRSKRPKGEPSAKVKQEFAEEAEAARERGDSDDEDKEDDLYDCPSLVVSNAKLRVKSNEIYRKIFSIHEPLRRARMWERLFLFSDLKVQSTVTMHTHLVFILGYEQLDLENYQNIFRNINLKLFYKTEEEDDEAAKEHAQSRIRLPEIQFIDGNVLPAARQQMYVTGGYFCIHSRVLVNDLLSGKILPEIIAGVVVMNAHQILEEYNIAFVVRLVRARNKLAFVKAITNNVHPFKGNSLGFCLKHLYTKNVHIFPRCHEVIEAVLNDPQIQPATFEVSLTLSENARAVYKSILRIIWTVVESMKRLKFDIDMNKVVYSSFRGLLKLLDKQVPNLNVYQMYINTASAVTNVPPEVKIRNSNNYYIDTLLRFRILLDNLLYLDPVTFVEQLERIKMESSNWVCTPNGINMYKRSNDRLFKIEGENIDVNIEKNRKFEYILDVLKSQVTCEHLAQMMKNNFKPVFHRRRWACVGRTRRPRFNLSVNERRLQLARTERNHLSFLAERFRAGKRIARNVLIVVENFYLVDYLTKYLKYDFHMNRMLELLQFKLTNDTAETVRSAKAPPPRSYSTEYYAGLNKAIMSKTNVYSLYKHLVSTTSPMIDLASSGSICSNSASPFMKVPVGSGSAQQSASEARVKAEPGFEDELEAEDTLDLELEMTEDGPLENGIELARVKPEPEAEPEADPDPDPAVKLEREIGIKVEVDPPEPRWRRRQPFNFKGPDMSLKEFLNQDLQMQETERTAEEMWDPEEPEEKPEEDSEDDVVLVGEKAARPASAVPRDEENWEIEIEEYLDINLPLDDFVVNHVDIVKSFSSAAAGKIDKHDRLLTTLMDVNPCLVVIYAPNVHVFRIVENYCALKFSRRDAYRKRLNFLQVHVLSYRDCLETHRFTKGLKSELDAWAYVQAQRCSMVVRLDESVLVSRPSAHGQVVVDTRELTSKLPFFLFNLGIQVVPAVLSIGDYLITRDICIERKSLTDLYMSLNSARMTKQLTEMCSAYEYPFLLIEFDEDEKFHFSSVGEFKHGHNYLYVKLIVNLVNFPKLRVIWSSSPQESANIIRRLKVGAAHAQANRSEPDLITNEYLVRNFRNRSERVRAGSDSEGSESGGAGGVTLRRPEFVKNRDALKILRAIPGVNSRNIAKILTKVSRAHCRPARCSTSASSRSPTSSSSSPRSRRARSTTTSTCP